MNRVRNISFAALLATACLTISGCGVGPKIPEGVPKDAKFTPPLEQPNMATAKKSNPAQDAAKVQANTGKGQTTPPKAP